MQHEQHDKVRCQRCMGEVSFVVFGCRGVKFQDVLMFGSSHYLVRHGRPVSLISQNLVQRFLDPNQFVSSSLENPTVLFGKSIFFSMICWYFWIQNMHFSLKFGKAQFLVNGKNISFLEGLGWAAPDKSSPFQPRNSSRSVQLF